MSISLRLIQILVILMLSGSSCSRTPSTQLTLTIELNDDNTLSVSYAGTTNVTGTAFGLGDGSGVGVIVRDEHAEQLLSLEVEPVLTNEHVEILGNVDSSVPFRLLMKGFGPEVVTLNEKPIDDRSILKSGSGKLRIIGKIRAKQTGPIKE